MRILLASLLLLALPIWALADEGADTGGDDAAMATAAGDWDAGCLAVPNGCSIDCIGIELACCKDCCSCSQGFDATLRVEFLDKDGTVIATGDVTDRWCDPCKGCRTGPLATFGSLDNAIDPCSIATARLSVVNGPENGINVRALTLWLRDPLGRLGVCEKWYKAWKCAPACCQMLGAGTNWTFTSEGCCNTCKNRCGCNKCESKCNSCNKCGTSKCGCDTCKPKCNTCAKPACGSCNKCASKCNTCTQKSNCGCNKCASKCNKCESKCNSCSHKSSCGCSKCGGH